ncbi:MAG: PHP domain-containing protein [Defluviitaleaceae bacterium]|nr:PHP domain-containing protein [Defluviitaleaceae bacterium]
MNFILDMHCHTVASGHAQNTLEEYAATAQEKDLALIGISDHGPAMSGSCPLSHFLDIIKWPAHIGGMHWLKGAEANIIDVYGGLDIPDNILSALDYCIVSVHDGLFLPGDADANTNAIIGAMENPYVNIIGHLGDAYVPINIKPIVAAAKKTKTIIEINNKSLMPAHHRYNKDGIVQKILAECKKQNVAVIAGSDAHRASSVGELAFAKALIEKVDIDEALVLNTSIERFMNAIKINKENKPRGNQNHD